MTNDEIIAERVMGYEYFNEEFSAGYPPLPFWGDGYNRQFKILVQDYCPSKNLEQAFEALEKYIKDNALTEYNIECKVSGNRKSYRCYLKGRYGEVCWGGGLEHWADTLPEAITATLVEVVGEE